MNPSTDHEVRPDRALPQWAVDLMINGVKGKDGNDPCKLWSKIMSLAMSACRRGWTKGQFISELTKVDKKRTLKSYRLWTQFRQHYTDESAYRQLHKAWDCAYVNINDAGERTKADLQADAVELAYRWVDRVTEGGDQLSSLEAAVLQHVASETERRAMIRVTCPSREVADAAKVSPMTACRTLKSLTTGGFLVKHSAGRPSGTTASRRAAVYQLADPETLPVGGRAPRRRQNVT